MQAMLPRSTVAGPTHRRSTWTVAHVRPQMHHPSTMTSQGSVPVSGAKVKSRQSQKPMTGLRPAGSNLQPLQTSAGFMPHNTLPSPRPHPVRLFGQDALANPLPAWQLPATCCVVSQSSTEPWISFTFAFLSCFSIISQLSGATPRCLTSHHDSLHNAMARCYHTDVLVLHKVFSLELLLLQSLLDTVKPSNQVASQTQGPHAHCKPCLQPSSPSMS